MKEPISIKEIFAIVLKQGRKILCAALIGAVLAGGLQAAVQVKDAMAPENSREVIEAQNQEAWDAYYAAVEPLEDALEDARKDLEWQQEYMENSLRMHWDSFHVYKCNIVLSIADIDEAALQQINEKDGKLVAYIVSVIQNQYVNYWKSVDLESELENHSYTDVDETYLREIVGFNTYDGAVINIYAYGEKEEDAVSLAEAIYAAILKAKPLIEESSFSHELKVINQSIKCGNASAIRTAQQENEATLQSLENAYAELEAKLEKVKEPVPAEGYTIKSALKAVITWMVLGAVVVTILACVVIWGMYIIGDGIETSRQMEAILGVPFLGAAAGLGSIWNQWACRFVGERQWKNADMAQLYISENVKNCVESTKKIALVTTLNIAEEDEHVQAVMSAIKSQGFQVSYANQAEENPEALVAIRNCDNVILLERLGKSRRLPVLAVVEMAKRMDTVAVGFVLV